MRKTTMNVCDGNLPDIMIDVAAINYEDKSLQRMYLDVCQCVDESKYDFPFVAKGMFDQKIGEIDRRIIK